MVEPTRSSASEAKPEIEHFINALNDSSQRSRTMLIGIIFTSILSSIALVNSMGSGWYQSRVTVRKMAMEQFLFPDDLETNQAKFGHKDVCCRCPLPDSGAAGEHPLHTYSSVEGFAYDLEECFKDTAKITRDNINSIVKTTFQSGSIKFQFPYWIRIKPMMLDLTRLPGKEERKELYSNLVKAAIFVKIANVQSREALEYSYNNLLQSQYENLMLVRVPILGIAFDINNLSLISSVVFLSLMVLLYLSMVRESRNLKTLFTHGSRDDNIDDRRLYELLSMYQVLTVPLKLYSPDKMKDKWTRMLIYGIFWLPFMVLLAIFKYDWDTYDIGASLNPGLTLKSTLATLFMLFLISCAAYKISDRQKRIDRQWDNQYYRLNLEKLFNLKDDDMDTGIWTNPEQVRINWANTVEAARRLKLKAGNIGEFASVNLLERFIDRCYDDKPDKLESSNNGQVEQYWAYFKTWFDANKQKSTRREFRESLVDLMNGPFEKPAK